MASKRAPKRKPRRINPNAKQLQRQPVIHRTDAQVIEAIRATKGNMYEICMRLHLRSPYALRQRINGNPALKDALLDARENLLGMAETVQLRKIEEGDWQPIKHVLDSFGREAGWAPKDAATVVNVNNPAQKMDLDITWGEGTPELPEDEG